jgi:hypothetical protein
MSWFSNKNSYPELDTPSTATEFNTCAEKSLQKVDNLKRMSGWVPLDFDDPDVRVWDQSESGSTVSRIKLKTTFPYSAMELASLLRSTDLDLLHMWDPDLLEKKQIEKISPELALVYTAYSAPWPVTSRDFLWLQVLYERFPTPSPSPPCTLIHGTFSVNSKKYPGNPDKVRGVSYSVWYLTPISDTKCKVTRVLELDPKGSIPAVVVQNKKLDAARQLVTLREMSAQTKRK